MKWGAKVILAGLRGSLCTETQCDRQFPGSLLLSLSFSSSLPYKDKDSRLFTVCRKISFAHFDNYKATVIEVENGKGKQASVLRVAQSVGSFYGQTECWQ